MTWQNQCVWTSGSLLLPHVPATLSLQHRVTQPWFNRRIKSNDELGGVASLATCNSVLEDIQVSPLFLLTQPFRHLRVIQKHPWFLDPGQVPQALIERVPIHTKIPRKARAPAYHAR